MNSTQSERCACDHCEGTGRIWEPCHVGYAHEYACDCENEVPCGNCDGTGTLARAEAC